MTRNNDRASQVRDAIGPPQAASTRDDPYQLAAWAKRYAAIMKGPPLLWAQSIHTMWKSGVMAPSKAPCDADKIGTSLRPDHRELALRAVARGENELRLRSMIKAIRMLAASSDHDDNKKAADILKGLELGWGIRRAYETVSEGDADLYDALKEQWGEVQLPPLGATVNQWAADEILIQATVRRVS